MCNKDNCVETYRFYLRIYLIHSGMSLVKVCTSQLVSLNWRAILALKFYLIYIVTLEGKQLYSCRISVVADG